MIQGSPVEIQQVGIHNFRIPLKYKLETIELLSLKPKKVTGTVSLEAHKKGINMSRIMRSFYEHKNETFSINKLENILEKYKEKLKSFESKIAFKNIISIIQTSLRSELEGYQYYNVTFEGYLNKDGDVKKNNAF